MKPLTSNITKGLTTGSRLVCADNSGAKEYYIINVLGVCGRRGRTPKAGIGDIIIVSVKKGTPKKRKTIVKALIVRQVKEFRRPNGMRIQFEDNAAVEIDAEKGIPIATEIKGAVAREISERYPKVSGIASIVV